MTRARNLANLGNKNAITADIGLFNIGIGSTQPTNYKLDVVGGNAYIGGGVTITGNLSVGGTVTYEDVTNVDSVGIITAAKGFRATAGGVVVTAGVSTFPVVAVSAGTTTKDLLVTGVTTATGNVLIGGPSHTSRALAVHATTNSVVLIEGASDGTSSLMLGDNDDEDVGMIQYNHADNDLAFTVNTGEALAIKSDGQLVSSGTGAELNLTNTGSTATEDTAILYTSGSGIHNRVLIKSSTNNGGDAFLKFDCGGQDMVVGNRYAGTTNNLLVLGPGNDPDTTSGIFVKGTGKVAIGTDNPQSNLHVASTSNYVDIGLSNSTSGHTGSDGANIFLNNSLELALWNRESTGVIRFATAGTERLRINNVGNLLQTLATDAQGFKQLNSNNHYIYNIIDCNRSAANDHIMIQQGRWNGTNVAAMKFKAGSDTSNKDDGYVTFETSSTGTQTERFRIDHEGLKLKTLDTGGGISINSLDSTSNYALFSANANRPSENDLILGLSASWNGDSVAQIDFRCGADTTNKDDGKIFFFTQATNAGGLVERMRIESDGTVDITGKLRIDISSTGTSGSGQAEGIFLRNTNQTDGNCVSIFGGADDYSAAASAINFVNVDHSANAGDITFDTRNGSNSYATRFKITSDGNIDIPVDSAKLRIGAGQDFYFMHNGTSNYVVSDNGVIHLRTNYGLHFDTAGSANTWMKCLTSDNQSTTAATSVELYYANVKEFETIQYGARAGGELDLYHQSSNSYIKNNTGNLHIGTDGGTYIYGGKDFGEYCATFLNDGAVTLYHNHSSRLATTANGASVYGNTGTIFSATCSTNSTASVTFQNNEANSAGDMALNIKTAANQGSDPYIFFDSGGSNMVVGQHWLGTTNNELRLGTGNAVHTVSGIAINGSGAVYMNALNSGSGASDVRYSTSSKQIFYDSSSRLVKTDIEDLSYGLDTINQLRPRIYKRTDCDGDIEVGFIADEVVNIIPEIVPTSEKSLFTKNEEDTEIVPSYVEYKRLTAVLTKAVQELSAKVDSLETEVAALKGS